MGSRKRWSSLFAVLCIALGTAAVSAVIALVEGSLWRPLPFPDADRLVRIWNAEPQGDPRVDLSHPELDELAAQLRGVDAYAGAARSRVVARLPGGAERLRGEAVDPGYFALLGLSAGHGRLFTAGDHAPDAAPTLLLSHALWTSRYGADPAVVGGTLQADGVLFRIAGVLPRGFAGTIEDDVVDFWIPRAQYLPATLRLERAARVGWTLARLAPGTTPAALQARRASAFPERYARLQLRSEPFGENWRAPLRQNATLLLGAVAVLLAIAVSNVAVLLLARALDRRQELALRAALGAGRGRLTRELVQETGRLALLGGALGAVAAPWLLQALLALAPLQLPGYLDLSFDTRTLLWVAPTLALAALAAALVPAWRGSDVAPQAVLGGEGRSSRGRSDRRLWSALMAGQVALSFVLLVGGALLLRSYVGLASLDLGFKREGVLRLAVTLAESDYGAMSSIPALQRRLQEVLARQPGVRAAGLVAPTLPPWDADRLALRHAALAADGIDALPAGTHRIDPALLATLDIPLLAGRGIDARDATDAPRVALVSAALAQRLGGAERALGSEIALQDERPNRPNGRYRIVGIVGDVAWDGVGEQDTGRYIRYGATDDARASRHDVYLALAQHPSPVVSIAVHGGLAPEQLIEPLRRAIAGVAPASALHWISAMDDELAGEYAASRFYFALVAAFGLTALLLAAVGLFALLSHAWMQRQHELGIRIALGADGARLARLLLRDGTRLVGVGLIAGALVAWPALGTVERALYGVQAWDPLAWTGAALLLAGVAAFAAWWPLRRALRLDPSALIRGS